MPVSKQRLLELCDSTAAAYVSDARKGIHWTSGADDDAELVRVLRLALAWEDRRELRPATPIRGGHAIEAQWNALHEDVDAALTGWEEIVITRLLLRALPGWKRPHERWYFGPSERV